MSVTMTIEELRQTLRKPRLKYGNKPTTNAESVRFASKAEAARDAELQCLAAAGKISGLERQPSFKLYVQGQKICTYRADWKYVEHTPDGKSVRVVEDKKGVQTAAFRIKFALAKALHPSIDWRLS